LGMGMGEGKYTIILVESEMLKVTAAEYVSENTSQARL
jgi:hypothetical protein